MSGDAPTFPDAFNMADYFVFSNIEAGRGDKVAIIFEDQRITYRQVADNVMKVARRLVDEGLLPEQRVLVCMQDRPEFVYAWFGAIKAGATVTQINPLLPAEDYEYYLNYVKPQFAFVDEASIANFDVSLRRTRHCNINDFRDNVIVAGRTRLESPRKVYFERDNAPPADSYEPDSHQSFDFWLSLPCDNASQPWPTRKDDPAVWLFTSGSTGQSKGAVHMHHHFAFNTEVYAKAFIGMGQDDITISGPRLFFGYATGTNLMFPFAVGATTVLFKEHPTPELLAGLIDQHRCTVLTSVPTLINKFIQSPSLTRQILASLRFMWSAGEALPAELHAHWEEIYGVPIIDGIGSAESFHIYISNRPGDIKPGSLGRLVPGYTARLFDDNDDPVGQGDVGTLWVRGDSVATHYHSAYDKSREHLRGGWIVSGDKFRQDAEGYWYYEGRGDDLLKVGGIFVSPLEVENCLMQHPAVKECCVIGKNDEAGLTKPLAIVVRQAQGARNVSEHAVGSVKYDTLAAELIAHCKAKLVRYKAPHWVKFVDQPLPRNDRDKIDRKLLRKQYGN